MTGSKGEPKEVALKNEFNIPHDVLIKGIAKYGESVQDELLWMAGYIREQKHNSRAVMCQLLDSDWTTISRIYKGKYSASIENFLSKIQAVRRAAVSAKTEFIETVVTKRIFDVMDISKDLGKMVMVTGGSGRSKTHAAKEWCMLNNHGKSIYIDVPAFGGPRGFYRELAKKLGIKAWVGMKVVIEKIEECIDRRHTIVVDEAVRLLPKGKTSIPTVLEFLRRLHDTTGCGIVFISTNIFADEMEYGHHKAYMEQLLGRMEEVVRIPKEILKSEVASICKAFNADADKELMALAYNTAMKQGKIRLLFTLIRQAESFAKTRNESLNAGHLRVAVASRDNRHSWPK